jgi:hypothetical protein
MARSDGPHVRRSAMRDMAVPPTGSPMEDIRRRAEPVAMVPATERSTRGSGCCRPDAASVRRDRTPAQDRRRRRTHQRVPVQTHRQVRDHRNHQVRDHRNHHQVRDHRNHHQVRDHRNQDCWEVDLQTSSSHWHRQQVPSTAVVGTRAVAVADDAARGLDDTVPRPAGSAVAHLAASGGPSCRSPSTRPSLSSPCRRQSRAQAVASRHRTRSEARRPAGPLYS